MTAQDPKTEPLPQGAVARMGSVVDKSYGHRGGVNFLSYSGNGKILASVGDSIRLWDLTSGKESILEVSEESAIPSVAISSDGRMVALGEHEGVQLREFPSGKEIRKLSFPVADRTLRSDFVKPLAFSPDGKTLLSIVEEKKIVLWDVALGKPVKEFHQGGVRSVGWSADGKLLAASGRSV
jgi:WD40 repeat protein